MLFLLILFYIIFKCLTVFYSGSTGCCNDHSFGLTAQFLHNAMTKVLHDDLSALGDIGFVQVNKTSNLTLGLVGLELILDIAQLPFERAGAETETGAVLAKGICERIGIEGSLIEHKKADGTKIKKVTPMADHSVATEIVVSMLTDAENGCIKSMDEIEAVGHRAVHGGQYFSQSVILTDEVYEILDKKCRVMGS